MAHFRNGISCEKHERKHVRNPICENRFSIGPLVEKLWSENCFGVRRKYNTTTQKLKEKVPKRVCCRKVGKGFPPLLALSLCSRFYSSHVEGNAVDREGTRGNPGIEELQYHGGSYCREGTKEQESRVQLPEGPRPAWEETAIWKTLRDQSDHEVQASS